MSDVTFKHPEYVKNLPYWQKLDDVCEGEDAVKAKGESIFRNPMLMINHLQIKVLMRLIVLGQSFMK